MDLAGGHHLLLAVELEGVGVQRGRPEEPDQQLFGLFSIWSTASGADQAAQIRTAARKRISGRLFHAGDGAAAFRAEWIGSRGRSRARAGSPGSGEVAFLAHPGVDYEDQTTGHDGGVGVGPAFGLLNVPGFVAKDAADV